MKVFCNINDKYITCIEAYSEYAAELYFSYRFDAVWKCESLSEEKIDTPLFAEWMRVLTPMSIDALQKIECEYKKINNSIRALIEKKAEIALHSKIIIDQIDNDLKRECENLKEMQKRIGYFEW